MKIRIQLEILPSESQHMTEPLCGNLQAFMTYAGQILRTIEGTRVYVVEDDAATRKVTARTYQAGDTSIREEYGQRGQN